MNKQEIKEIWNGLKDLCENGETYELKELARKSLNLIEKAVAHS